MCYICASFDPFVPTCKYDGLAPSAPFPFIPTTLPDGTVSGSTDGDAFGTSEAAGTGDETMLVVDETTDAPDDAIDAPTTPYVLDVGDSFNGELDVDGDVDIIALNVEAGVTYTFTMTPGTMVDPLFAAYDSNGDLIAVWDQAFDGQAETLSLTALEDGVVYVGLTSFYNTPDGDAFNPSFVDTGTYTVTFEEFDFATNAPTDAITWNYTAPSVIDVYFMPGGQAITETAFGTNYTSTAWSAADQANALAAFALFEEITNLQFNFVTDQSLADFVMIQSDNAFSSPNSLGYWGIGGGELQIGGSPINVDGWGVFNGSAPTWTAGTDQGSYGFVTLVHEIAHGLGLAHPHDFGGTSTLIPDVVDPFGFPGLFGLNQGVFTTMSYNTGWITSPFGTPGALGGFGFEGTPMALDIAVLQQKYGANTTHANGDDIYQLLDVNGIGTFFSSIWDTDGTDTIEYAGSADALIDLRAATLEYEEGGGGFISFVDGIFGGFTIANGVVIENATGGSGNDIIMGNDANNTLLGGFGADTLIGGAGSDSIDGGTQFDYIEGGDGTDHLLGGMGNDTLDGGAQNDRLSGGNGNDLLLGGLGVDILRGGRGEDTLDGGNRNDILIGGTEDDVLLGGNGDDALRGGGQNDLLDGGAGNDYLLGGAGFDILIGGEGDDILVGAFNADRFIFDDNHGNDVIEDFDANWAPEKIIFSGHSTMNSLTDVIGTGSGTAAATQVGADVLIDTGSGTILLKNVDFADLGADDFVF